MSEAALTPLVVPGLLSVIIAQQWLYNRRLWSLVQSLGRRLKSIEALHGKNHPEDLQDFKIGGSI